MPNCDNCGKPLMVCADCGTVCKMSGGQPLHEDATITCPTTVAKEPTP